MNARRYAAIVALAMMACISEYQVTRLRDSIPTFKLSTVEDDRLGDYLKLEQNYIVALAPLVSGSETKASNLVKLIQPGELLDARRALEQSASKRLKVQVQLGAVNGQVVWVRRNTNGGS